MDGLKLGYTGGFPIKLLPVSIYLNVAEYILWCISSRPVSCTVFQDVEFIGKSKFSILWKERFLI